MYYLAAYYIDDEKSMQAHGKIVKQWRSLESAADGTIRNRIFR